TCSSQLVRARAVFLCPADRGVNRHVGYVDTLRHQFSCHALRESSFGLTCHCKGAAQWETFERCACVGEDDRSLRAVGIGLVFAHESSCLLTYQKRAERRVPECVRMVLLGHRRKSAAQVGGRISLSLSGRDSIPKYLPAHLMNPVSGFESTA